ncbi:hypothetical protein QJS10_CPA08g01930 [Acorus calamus]|uniref:Uncharacterized protein n=1 Tax=Acorus calamus TaxID=4465 RepID=A0AAV9E998_ACOCL|nr:hypothetical protein QJS10_CPA08g01930 [Acorus calamus]
MEIDVPVKPPRRNCASKREVKTVLKVLNDMIQGDSKAPRKKLYELKLKMKWMVVEMSTVGGGRGKGDGAAIPRAAEKKR